VTPGLLVVTGVLFGVFAPLAKVAAEAGVPPLGYLFWLAAGAGLSLGVLTKLGGKPPPVTWHYARYGLISGCVSFALPNLVVVLVVPHIGAGLTSVVFVLSPVLTYAMALGVRLETMRPVRALGVALGCAGALMIVLPRSGLPSPDLVDWMVFALLIPVLLAAGNIYRTVDWPPGAFGPPLATVMMLGASFWLAVAMIVFDQIYWPFAFAHRGDFATIVQIVVMAVSYVTYFELQHRSGPVYLSQISYLITITGVGIGVIVFSEQLTWWIWGALPVMFAGLMLVNARKAQTKT
jgi:drug/metabolite transporter (DMT)-like permease